MKDLSWSFGLCIALCLMILGLTLPGSQAQAQLSLVGTFTLEGTHSLWSKPPHSIRS